MESYGFGLSKRPQIIVASKMDEEGATDRLKELEKKIEDAQAGIINDLNKRSEIKANSEAMAATLEQFQIRRSEYAQKILKAKSDLATVQSQYNDETKKLEVIGLPELFEAGFINKSMLVKILGTGTLTAKLTVKANAFSKSAEAAIVAAGGSVERI